MHINIERLQQENLDELLRVFSKSVLVDFPEYSDRTRTYFAKKTDKEWLVKNKKIILGAYIDSSLVGYLIANEPEGGISFCDWLGVLSDYRGKGVGKALLRAFERIARQMGAHNIRLESDKRNVVFYEKFGFVCIGLDKKGSYGADSYIMKKQIQEPIEDNFLQ